MYFHAIRILTKSAWSKKVKLGNYMDMQVSPSHGEFFEAGGFMVIFSNFFLICSRLVPCHGPYGYLIKTPFLDMLYGLCGFWYCQGMRHKYIEI